MEVSGSLLGGSDGCNNHTFSAEDGTLVFGPDWVFLLPSGGWQTLVHCPQPEGVMAQADAYMSASHRERGTALWATG